MHNKLYSIILGVTVSVNSYADTAALPKGLIDKPLIQVKDKLQSSGWVPITNREVDEGDFIARDLVQNGYPEVEGCTGAGIQICTYLYRSSNGQKLRVTAIGEGDSTVSAIAVVNSSNEGGLSSTQESITKAILGADYPQLNQFVNNLFLNYQNSFKEHEEYEIYATKKMDHGQSNTLLANEAVSGAVLSASLCDESIKNVTSLREGRDEMQKALGNMGNFNGNEMYQNFLDIRKSKISKGERQPNMSTLDLDRARSEFIAAFDIGAPKNFVVSVFTKTCQYAQIKTFGKENQKFFNVAQESTKYYTRRPDTVGNREEQKKIEIKNDDPLKSKLSDEEFNYKLALLMIPIDYDRAVRSQTQTINYIKGHEKEYCAFYANALNKLAAISMIRNGDGSLQAKGYLEASISFISECLDVNRPISEEDPLYGVLQDNTEMLSAASKASSLPYSQRVINLYTGLKSKAHLMSKE